MFFGYSSTQISSVTALYFTLVCLCIGCKGEPEDGDNH